MDRNDFDRRALMRNYLTDQAQPQPIQPPVGIGPFAPGPAGVLSPESLDRLAKYEQALTDMKEAQSVPPVQFKPVTSTPNYRGFVQEPLAKTLPAKPKVPQPSQEKATPKAQAPVPQAPVEGSQQAPTPEAPVTDDQVDATIEQVKSEMAKTPEEAAAIDAKLRSPDPEGSGMSLGQKLAIIAMAVAPTAVGYALEGRKGAYLGAAATGKGLQEGVEAYGKEEAAARAERKLDIEQMKAEKTQKAKEQKEKDDEKKYAKDITNEFGQIFEVYRDGTTKPRIDPTTGGYMFAPNEPRTTVLPSGEEITGQRYRERPRDYPTRPSAQAPAQQQQPAQQPTPGTRPLGYKGGIQSELDDINAMRQRDFKLGPVAFPKDIQDVAATGIERDMTTEELRAKGIDPLKYRGYIRRVTKFLDDERNRIEELRKAQMTKAATPAKPSQKQSKVDSAELSIYTDSIKKFNSNEWKDYRNKQANAEYFFQQPVDQLKKASIADSGLWFNYMKEIQLDNSVVREGDLQTAYAFMPLSTRVQSFFNQYGPNFAGKMTDGMRKDIIEYLKTVRGIRERIMMMDINDHVDRGTKIGFERPAISGPAIAEAQSWASRNGLGSAKTYGMAGGTPIWDARIKDMVQKGELKNGQFIKDTNGQPYLIKFILNDNRDKIVGVKPVKWVVSNGAK